MPLAERDEGDESDEGDEEKAMSDERGSDRRQFVQMGLAGLGAALASGAAAQTVNAADQPVAAAKPVQPSFLCVYRPGPRWLPGKPL